MSRSQRLLALLELLRQHRYPVSGKLLAEKLDISLRTLYRIQDLSLMASPFPKRRQNLLKQWRELHSIPEQ